ncbi:MAG: TolC family protein [Gemmatimonadaceae bacterium]|nr:TolC family protein [Gemmatimonadaceae bacterium]
MAFTRKACRATMILGLTVMGGSLRAQAVMPFSRYAAQVEANHPIAQQARLVAAQARTAMQEAWGAFDPKLSLSFAQKAYKGEQYFSYLDAGVKVPTPIGADLKLGFERASGFRVSDDRTTPRSGLFSLGLSVPVGQRLITDERRTAFTIARAQREIGDAERQGMINKLLLDAAKAYGAWYAAERRFEIAAEGVTLATFRLQAVEQRVRNGENAPIDTLEASLEVQRRAVARLEAENERLAARVMAAVFLWDSRGQPEELPPDAQPVLAGLDQTTTDTTRLAIWIAAVASRHPELRKVEGKLRAAQAERLFAQQAQIPFAEATVAAIGDRDPIGLLGASDRWRDNFKAGLDVESSLLLLKERGKAARSRQKEEFVRLDRDLLRRELAYDVRLALNDVVLLERVLTAQRANVRSASQLRDAEQTRFSSGESTLLVVNLRERLVLDESAKLATVEGKLAAARAALVVAVGDASLIR